MAQIQNMVVRNLTGVPQKFFDMNWEVLETVDPESNPPTLENLPPAETGVYLLVNSGAKLGNLNREDLLIPGMQMFLPDPQVAMISQI